jgi:F-type H+-transporting ATPase subunit b
MVRRIGAAALLLLFALPAQAESPEGEEFQTLLYTIGNFLILLGVVVYFARKPTQAFFAARRNEIKTDLEGAADQFSESEATYAKWQRRLVDLEEELDEIRATSRQRAEAERERILSDAQSNAERIRRNATTAVKLELRRAREELRKEATQLAIELAAERLNREVNEADRDRLLDEFIDRVAEMPSANSDQREGF